MYHYWALFALKCHYLAYFAVMRIFNPDANFDQDGPRYTQRTVMYCNVPLFGLIFALKCHCLAYFAVIRIQMQIFDPDADFDQDGSRYTQCTVMYHYLALLP